MSRNYLPLITLLFLIALTVGSLAFYRTLTSPPKPTIVALVTPTSTPTQVLGKKIATESAKPKIELTIDSPLAQASVSSSLLRVAGKTATEAGVLVNDKKVFVDQTGNFTTSIRLTQGPNLIVIEASNSGVKSIWQTVVTYEP